MIRNSLILGLVGAVMAGAVSAGEVKTNLAQMQAMDKITGRVSLIEVPVGGEVKFGSFSIVVRDCQTRTPEETPDNFAFVDVADEAYDGTRVNIFKGWMVSSSPALNAVEHPIYDVWLKKCVNGEVDAASLLSADELAERDGLDMMRTVVVDETGREISEIEEEVVVEEEPLIEEVLKEEVVVAPVISGGAEGGPKALFNIETVNEEVLVEHADEIEPEVIEEYEIGVDEDDVGVEEEPVEDAGSFLGLSGV